MTQKSQICLWYNHDAQDAAQFYAATFPDTRIRHIQHAPADNPSGREGDVLTIEMDILGIPTVLLNGGPVFAQSEAFSFMILTDDQEETDRYWNAIVDNGGQESMCGWCKDKWGLSWQITPRVLLDAQKEGDPAMAKRVFEAMMTMRKIDVAAIETARKG